MRERERERIIRKEGRDGQLAIKGRTHFPNCCPDRGLGFRPHETQVIQSHPPANCSSSESNLNFSHCIRFHTTTMLLFHFLFLYPTIFSYFYILLLIFYYCLILSLKQIAIKIPVSKQNTLRITEVMLLCLLWPWQSGSIPTSKWWCRLILRLLRY